MQRVIRKNTTRNQQILLKRINTDTGISIVCPFCQNAFWRRNELDNRIMECSVCNSTAICIIENEKIVRFTPIS